MSLVEALDRLAERDFNALEALAAYREALRLGRLHVCANCRHFTAACELAGLGRCKRFNVDAWPLVAFWCSGFEASRTPAAPAYLPEQHDGISRPVRARAL